MTPADLQQHLPEWQQTVAHHTPEQLLQWASHTFPGHLTFATSLGAEDQVLTHMLATAALPIPLFTLDTGRLFPQIYDLIAETQARYNLTIRIMFPDTTHVEQMVAEHGINLFRNSVDLRRTCCGIRKLEPLRRAFQGHHAWITGLRRDQSITRTDTAAVEWDETNQLIKISPLYNWTNDQVWAYIHEHNVPYNPLHDEGFLSIGCACCTRAVQPGEDIRAGRWWWETPDKKECGLHFKDGKLVRGPAPK